MFNKEIRGFTRDWLFFILGLILSFFFFDKQTISIQYGGLFLFIGFTIAASSFLLKELKIRKFVEPLIALSITFLFVAILLSFFNMLFPVNLYSKSITIFFLYLIFVLIISLINGRILWYLYKIATYYRKDYF